MLRDNEVEQLNRRTVPYVVADIKKTKYMLNRVCCKPEWVRGAAGEAGSGVRTCFSSCECMRYVEAQSGFPFRLTHVANTKIVNFHQTSDRQVVASQKVTEHLTNG